jgi:C-terminal processing protease CtpA/Prc
VKLRGALPAVFALCAACGAIVGPDLPNSPAALFDQVWSDLDQHYSLFIVKQINWDSLRAVYRPLVLAADREEQASVVIANMLSRLHDDHVVFRGTRVGTSLRGIGYVPTATSAYIGFQTDFASGVSFGWAGAAVGYIYIPTFDGTLWLPALDSALTVLGGASSIIVDVRNNDGGFLENATAVAGRFTAQTTTVAYVRYRNGLAHTDFTGPIAQQVVPAGPRRFTGNVYLLTSRNTISAAELFVLSMHALGHTTVVGDTTAGETGSPFSRELQNGWTYQFPESVEFTLDGKTFEDIGLPPDVPVRNTSAQIARNVDTQLARTIALAQGKP